MNQILIIKVDNYSGQEIGTTTVVHCFNAENVFKAKSWIQNLYFLHIQCTYHSLINYIKAGQEANREESLENTKDAVKHILLQIQRNITSTM